MVGVFQMQRVYVKCSSIKKLEDEMLKNNENCLEKFWRNIRKKGTPIVEEIDGDKEHCLVTLIYREKKKLNNVVLIPPVGMRKLENCKMDKVKGTDLWYITYKVRKDIRFSYQFSPDDPLDNDWERRWKNVQDDEFNNNKLNFTGKVSDKYRLVPYAVMENAKKHKWVKEYEKSKKGRLEKYYIYSSIFKEERSITIYTPYDYSEKNEPYGVILLNDGFEYINILSAKNVLDNLISKGEIPPIAAIFVDSTKDRALNLKCSDEFNEFLSKEVMNFVKDRYNISNDPKKNVVGGYSLGGLAASYMALKHSDIFGNVLSQSGSYWYKRDGYNSKDELWIVNQFKNSTKLPVKFYINVGVIEPKMSMIDTNFEFSKTLRQLGYNVKFDKFGSGHDYLCWGETLAYGLKYLLGTD